MFRGLYGNGVLGIPGTVLRSTVSECVSAGRSVTPPECKWTVWKGERVAQITKIPFWLPGNVPVATPRLQTVLNRRVDDVMPLHYGSPLKRSTLWWSYGYLYDTGSCLTCLCGLVMLEYIAWSCLWGHILCSQKGVTRSVLTALLKQWATTPLYPVSHAQYGVIFSIWLVVLWSL